MAAIHHLLPFPVLPLVFAVPVPAHAANPPVCALSCDTRDPSLARQETFPLGTLLLHNRRLVLHLSAADGMAWGSIDAGVQGDAVWLDRTFDGGAGWEGPLGKAAIPGTWTGYLDEAVTIADYVAGFWDTSTCGGGVWWDRERTYKSAVTIGLYLRLTAALHKDAARRLGTAALASSLVQGGVLTESCDRPGRSCDDNQKQFKGVFMRYLNEAGQQLQSFATAQANSLWPTRDPMNRVGSRWAAPPSPPDWRTQGPALQALTVAP